MNRVFDHLEAMDRTYPELDPHTLVIYSDGSGFIRDSEDSEVFCFEGTEELIKYIGKFSYDNRPLKLQKIQKKKKKKLDKS